ncbi:MAG: hypothetical protein ACUVUD_02770 [bacterium]
MSKSMRETVWTIAYISAGIFAALSIWKLLSTRHITKIPLPPLIILGFAGGLIYAAVRLRGLTYAIMMVILLFFLQLALTPPLRTETAIRAALWATPIGFSFLVSGYLFKYLSRLPVGKFLFMALIIGLAHLTVVLLFRLRTGQEFPRGLLTYQFIVGALFGTVFGILIEILELLFRQKKQEPNFDFPLS